MAASGASARPAGFRLSPVEPDRRSKAETAADSAEVHFRLSSADLDLALDGNGERLGRLLSRMHELAGQDSAYVLRTLRVIGSASPEGTQEINRLLSEQRAHSLFDYVAGHFTLPDSIKDFEYLGRNWSGLYNLVAADPSVPSQGEVLALLRPAATVGNTDATESNRLLQRLKALDGGVPYAYMYRRLFPALRYSYLYVEYEKRLHREIEGLMLKTIEAEEAQALPVAEVAEVAEEAEVADTPAPPVNVVTPAPKLPKNFYMDIRTNMLYDLAAIPNIGVEFYLGRNITLSAQWIYSWWSYDRRHRYWRLYGGDLGLRWWFGRKAHEKPLTGHHLGIYAGALIFDFEWGGNGYMGGKPGATLWQRCLVNAGVEYGYSLPVSRRLNIDFSIGIGYLGGKYIKYYPFDNDYYRDKDYKLRFFGPTKAEISLVWLLGRGNVNKRKGGGR